MFGKLELARKGASGNALMQKGWFGAFIGLLLALDGQYAIADLDTKILFGEAGNGKHDAIMVLVAALDIVGRVALGVAVCLIQQTQQAVKADSGTVERGMIQTHNTTS